MKVVTVCGHCNQFGNIIMSEKIGHGIRYYYTTISIHYRQVIKKCQQPGTNIFIQNRHKSEFCTTQLFSHLFTILNSKIGPLLKIILLLFFFLLLCYLLHRIFFLQYFPYIDDGCHQKNRTNEPMDEMLVTINIFSDQ